ncbi:aldehyde dehydrogenase [Rhodococcus sp. 06-156-3C]|nr:MULTISPECIES: aldehyde dehydrogenase [unclassified Rhodococcus (in: high G+C Gram-positive bacteria)]OZD11963.1 aldehyde dehydrogenase [Rhodococcus sp. 06-156-4C]OZD15710.1 aldehyde dehydrogenase [Rhodococcus sp. 06-156-4a]OZD23957.1 aldehyde dehydrogenase [Rhodococcus sp. 06-156-3C]OZD27316.1 aldehyde dehydrogenase [Rhodococcus sp. 06-156-3b]OZD31655.1 aldehyde dehydrogenase [Rhodococcus sp. 06-156-3]
MEDRHGKLFVDGQWIAARGERIPVVSPATEKLLADVASASTDDIDVAVAAARKAFDVGPWPRMSLDERIAVVTRLRDVLVDHSESIADLITTEMGCPITQSRAIQAVNPVRVIDAYLDFIGEYPFRAVRSGPFGNALVTREPVGVVGAVVPWNVPMGISVQKMVPALLAGCTFVLKPAPQTTLDAYLLAELIEQAGFPPGVVNVVPAEREASEHLIAHHGVDKVTFTGSTGAGRRIAALCGTDLRRVTLELGGKSAAVVLDDADMAATAEALRMGSFRNNGQICTLKTRILVSEKRENELLDSLAAMIDTMAVGDPHADSTEIGPLFTERHRTTVENYIRTGQEEGGRIVRGGGRPADLAQGWYVEPTIIAGVSRGATVAQEEIFGPVVSVITYRDEDDAIAIANDSQYGLNGAVFSSDLERGLRVASKLRTGVVELNGNPIGLQSPFGGFKMSGIGRENGVEGLDAYTELRSIGLPSEFARNLA